VTLTARDRRILMVILPIVVLIAFWFLILSPKRDDLSKARDAQHAAEQARDAAVAQANQLEAARQTFAADYATVVRIGKAIPVTVDSPSLLIQLSKATNGTHIDMNSVSFGVRAPATLPAPATTTTTNNLNGAEQPAGNAAAGGAPAATGFGQATESAGNAVAAGNAASTAAGGGTTGPTSTTPPTPAPASTVTPPALDSVPLTFNFTGTYFDLADFLHRLKRFVYVVGNRIIVRGRLLSIDTLAFTPGAAASSTTGTSPSGLLTATVGATVYLASATQGATGGATPQGPAGTTTTTTTPAGSQTSSVPLATVSAR
jgi:Tfp pilus assembly protein PilO